MPVITDTCPSLELTPVDGAGTPFPLSVVPPTVPAPQPLMRFSLAAAFILAALPVAAATAEYNVQDFGAIPDGRTKDTAAIAKAIAACTAAGGGTVVFPAGRYLTGSIEMESDLTLKIEAGAELLYSGDPKDSPIVAGRWESSTAFTHAPLIHAFNKENVAVVGRGTINGQGSNWWWRNTVYDRSRSAEAKPAQAAWLALLARIEKGETFQASDFTQAAEYLRPSLVQFNGCKNVLVDGVTITESPMWLLHPLYCENVVVHGVNFISTGPNGDGLDIDSSRDVRISDCFFTTGDDCIVIKSGRDADGRRTARPTEHIVVTNCVMYKGHGAIVIGSETSGDIRDIAASNIVARGTLDGIRIKSQRGRGGVIENMRFDNFVIEDAAFAIEITGRYQQSSSDHANAGPAKFSEQTPIFRNLSFSNLTIVHARQVATVAGLEEQAILGLRFSDITATGTKGFLCDLARDVELHHVRVDVTSGPEFSFTRSNDLTLDDVTSHVPNASNPVIKFATSDEVLVRSSRAVAGTGTFLQVDAATGKGLHLVDNDLSLAKTPQDSGK